VARNSWTTSEQSKPQKKKDQPLFSSLLKKKVMDEYPAKKNSAHIPIDDDLSCLNDAINHIHLDLEDAELDKENMDRNAVIEVHSAPSSPFSSPLLAQEQASAIPPLMDFPESSLDHTLGFSWNPINDEELSMARPKSVNGRPSPTLYGDIRRPFSPQPSLLNNIKRPAEGFGLGFSNLAPSEFGSSINLDLDLNTLNNRTYNANYGFPNGSLRTSPLMNAADADATSRSSILEEFRNNKGKKYEIHDLQQYVVEFSCDQHGSRFIQQKLETATDAEKQMVFDELQSHALKLMTDVFGNYVIQKLFEYGSTTQKTLLAKQMQGHVLSLSLQMYGCRVVQKALEHVHIEQQAILIKELDGQVLKCVKDQNGNHVIQKCIERVPSEMIQFIIDSFNNQVYSLATHPYGCRVIQRIFEHCTFEQTMPLLDEIHKSMMNLIQDQYGNYVIQHILERGSAEDKQKIMDKVSGNILSFSKHKFASNVIEKCVAHGTPAQQTKILDELTSNKNDGNSPLFQMMKDQYANYVVQKMLDVFRDQVKISLIAKIRPLIPQLKKFSYGKHIIAKLENGSQSREGGYRRERH
jgi:hypothetical protein